MEIQFTWKTKLFSKSFKILHNDAESGEIRKESWSRKVNGRLFNTSLLFETKGFFRQQTNIINLKDNTSIGQIIFNKWKARSIVEYNGREFQWQFDNFFRTKWSLGNENGPMIKFHSHGFKGTITCYTKDEVLILATFFVRNYIKQRSAEIAAAT